QQADVQGLVFQCDGLFVYGPNFRLRLDLNLRTGESGNRTETYCDGNTRWEVRHEPGRKPEARRLDWAKVNQVVNQSGVPAQDREQILSSLGFSGVLPLLKSLRQDLTLTKQEKARWNDRDVFKLTGVWKSEVLRMPIPTAQWPGSMPRQCVLFLDSKTSLPYRLEWWGPTAQGAPDSILLQLEFRNPTVNVVMSPERAAQIFRY